MQHTPEREVDYNARSLFTAVSLLPAYCSLLCCAQVKVQEILILLIQMFSAEVTDEEKPKIACWMFGPLKTRHPV
jgi:hypothetical protein